VTWKASQRSSLPQNNEDESQNTSSNTGVDDTTEETTTEQKPEIKFISAQFEPNQLNGYAVNKECIVSGKAGKGVILNVTDRKSRSVFLERIVNVTIKNVHKAFLKIKERFPELKTITTDNDLLLAMHKELETLLKVKIHMYLPLTKFLLKTKLTLSQ